MRKKLVSSAAALTGCALLAGCATTVSNQPVTANFNPTQSYTFDNWIESRNEIPNGDLIVLSFSGGGSRAAALAASVLKTLHEHQLTDRIAIISSTSGGSVTAGYYAATGVEGLDHLKSNFLAKNNTAALSMDILPGLLVGANRSRLFANYLDRGPLSQRFPGRPATYADLMQRWPNAPFVVMNATDASTGLTVELTQDYFSHLCSDLGAFRISEAMAASASFPFLFTPIPLRNHWDQPACRTVIGRYEQQYEDAYKNRFLNLESFVKARYFDSLRNTYRDPGKPAPGPGRPYREINYVHLIDGGLSDNLAARALLRTFSPDVLNKLVKRNLKRILLVQVNAKGESPRPIDKSPDAPSIGEIVQTAVLNPLDITTALSSHISKTYWVNLITSVNASAAAATTQDQRSSEINLFPVQVDFDHIDATNENDSNEMAVIKAIGTDWRLEEGKLDLIYNVGKRLLNAHPCFHAFLAAKGNKTISTGCDRIALAQSSQRFEAMPGIAPDITRPVVTSAPVPVPLSEKLTYTAEVLFAPADSALHAAGKRALADFAAKLGGVHMEVVIVIGHADDTGSVAFNQRLSERRARVVKAYLVSLGIASERIYTEGKGESQPLDDNSKAAGRLANRRVELELVGTRR